MCLGIIGDTNGNVMNIIWSYGGKLVEADNKTVTLHSPGTVKAVQLIADMYHKHKIIPKGAVGWDNTGNNKAYQSRQVIFVQNATSIYAHLAESDKDLYNVTGLLPTPAGPAGAFETLGSQYWCSSSTTPIPSWPGDWPSTGWPQRTCGWCSRKGTDAGGHRTGACSRPTSGSGQCSRIGSRCWSAVGFASPGTAHPAVGEVASTYVIGRMMHRVLVDSWEAERAVEEAHKKVVEIYARHQEA